MKKLLLLLIVIASATQLRAQQSTIKPFDQNLFKTPKDQSLLQFKPGDSTQFKSFSAQPKGEFLAVTPYKLPDYKMTLANSFVNIDHMPIAKVSGNIDRMLIAKPDGKMEKMPVAKVAPLGVLTPATP